MIKCLRYLPKQTQICIISNTHRAVTDAYSNIGRNSSRCLGSWYYLNCLHVFQCLGAIICSGDDLVWFSGHIYKALLVGKLSYREDYIRTYRQFDAYIKAVLPKYLYRIGVISVSTCQRIHSNTYSHICHIIFLVYILKTAYIFITEILLAPSQLRRECIECWFDTCVGIDDICIISIHHLFRK